MSSAGPQGLQAFPEALSTREAWLEPFDWYREMRENAPVRYDPERSSWDVFRYDDVKRILDDDETFSVDPEKATDFIEPEGEGEGLILDTMLFEDPPRHDELRGVVEEPFRPRAVRDLEPRIRELAADLLDDVLANDDSSELDIVSDLAYPLPVIVIAELLGVPADDRDRFKEWSDAIVASTSDREEDEEYEKRQQEVQREMGFYFLQLIEERRENPQNDLVSTIATAEIDGEPLPREEALGMCMLLLVAGNITTTNLITNAMRCFGDNGLFEEFTEESHVPTTAIEEVLRYRSPVQAMTRIATEEATLRGETIETGDRIIVWLGSGNRDERQFANGNSFVPDRAPNQHLGFGHGTHYCLGAPLARLEAEVALSELFDRLADVEFVEATLRPTRSSFIYGVESLPIRYTTG